MPTHRLAFLLLAALCACTQKNTDDACDDNNPCPDGQICQLPERRCIPAVPTADLTMTETADLRMSVPPDMTMSACAGKEAQFASSEITLPSSGARYQLDFDGDGKAENQFDQILSTLALANFDLQPPVTAAVTAGQLVALLKVAAPDLSNAACAEVRLNTAEPRAAGDPPSYDGTDTFKVPMGQPPTELRAEIKAGHLDSTRPTKLPADNVPRLDINLPILGGGLPLSLYGVHVQGDVSPGGIMTGEVHGVLRSKDVDAVIVPAIATLVTLQINADPGSTTTQTLISLLEDPKGTKCTMTPKDCCTPVANRPTCKITADEVRANALIASVLKADVQVFDGDKWKPVTPGTKKDALSIGLGFRAVVASF